jgi:hypothetical protein
VKLAEQYKIIFQQLLGEYHQSGQMNSILEAITSRKKLGAMKEQLDLANKSALSPIL